MSLRKKNPGLDLVQIQTRAEKDRGRFWQSLDELAETQEYRDFLNHEFPYDPAKEPEGISRRDALKLMAASAALAGLTACTRLPTEKIVPYAQQPPEEFIPGKPLFYATAVPQSGIGLGVLVESHMGRPTKVEGNPTHPGSLGAADFSAQASVLNLYDPDRSQVVLRNGRIGSWSEFLLALEQLREDLLPLQGEGLRILTETVTSPALGSQLRALLQQFPRAKWHQYEPCGRDAAREGARLAFGEYVNTIYRFDQAEVVLSLDADFLCSGPGSVRYARDFAGKRRISGPDSAMNRLYVVESMPTNTGAMADHRLPLRAAEVEPFARALAAALGLPVTGASAAPARIPASWIPALARDLQKHRGAGIVLAGDHQPPAVHALAHAMNQALGNAGKTVLYTAPLEVEPVNELASLRELVNDMQAGRVETLLILGGNPVYTAPADFRFAQTYLRVGRRIHLALYDDETSHLSNWHINEAHYLESWGDVRAYDGTVSILQPLIAPLYDGKTAGELLAVLLGEPGATPHSLVHGYWQKQNLAKDFELLWEKSLNDGIIATTALPPRTVSLRKDFAGVLPAAGAPPAAQTLEVVFRPDPTVGDGRFANNGWLQELPKPLTKLTWDNVAMVSLDTAQRLRVTNEDVVRLRYRRREVEAPVWIMPGHADDSVSVFLGYGRERAGGVGTGIGYNAYALRPSEAPWIGSGLEVEKAGRRYTLAATQHHHIINREHEEESDAAERRDLVRVSSLEDFRKDPGFARNPPEETTQAPSLYPPHKYEGYSWGMAIDLNSCVGCNACVVACKSENNIPVVGKQEVANGREMDWIRIDTYYRGGLENPEAYNQAVLCMQCENAPCEVVCPVGATVHSPEGINEMVYNRCVGTRYCSNNCPYKVRRFNFRLYSDWTTPSLMGLRNPNVTVRSRGVMEKCTYCIQRINARKIEAEEQERELRDGEIQTACQQTCPTQAIVFGNINDPSSQVSKLKAQSRNYGILADLNTRPRTTYLARLRNPNPEIKE